MARETKSSLAESVVSDRTAVGIFSVYGNRDSYSDIMQPGAMAKTLRERGGRILHLWQHAMGEPPIAVIEGIREVPREMLPSATLERAPDALGGAEVTRRYLDTPRGNEVLKALQDGAPLEMSFAFDALAYDFTEDEKAPLGVVRNLREIRLYETSDVNWGANDATVATRSSGPIPLPTLIHLMQRAIKGGARHSKRDTEMLNQIASLAIELGATNAVIQAADDTRDDEEMQERAADLAREPVATVSRTTRTRTAEAALRLLRLTT